MPRLKSKKRKIQIPFPEIEEKFKKEIIRKKVKSVPKVDVKQQIEEEKKVDC